jgi:hypothetical protein
MALPATPDESEERRRQAAIGCPFFWLLFFGQAKKSASAVGPSTHSQMNPREAKPSLFRTLEEADAADSQLGNGTVLRASAGRSDLLSAE